MARALAFKFRVHSPPPATLHLNSEARQVTLGHYIPFFEADNNVTYFNPDLDALFTQFFPYNRTSVYLPSFATASQRFRTALAVVRHIVIQYTGLHATFVKAELVHFLGRQASRGNLPALQAVDYCEPLGRHLNQTREEPERQLLGQWVRLCRDCDCTYFPAYVYPNGISSGRTRWRLHVVATGCQVKKLSDTTFPFRSCQEVQSQQIQLRRLSTKGERSIEYPMFLEEGPDFLWRDPFN